MNAYKITLQLIEENDGEEERSSIVQIITVAQSLAEASEYAKKAYTEADETTEGFRWEAIASEMLLGKVALPTMKKVEPKTP